VKIDLTNCKTPEDVERAMKPLGEVMGRVRRLLAGEEAGHAYAEFELRTGSSLLTHGQLSVVVSDGELREVKPRRKRREKGAQPNGSVQDRLGVMRIEIPKARA
jgi:hypothetical protein